MARDDIKLRRPSMAYAREIAALRSELLAAHEGFDGCSGLEKYDAVPDWLAHLAQIEDAASCPAGHVPASTWLAVRAGDDRVVGIINLRHHIDHPILSVWGGHIGYTVRPAERGKGYGKQMLRKLLPMCRAMELDKVLITCDDDNSASAHVILANGGVLEKCIEVNGERIRRYWITL